MTARQRRNKRVVYRRRKTIEASRNMSHHLAQLFAAQTIKAMSYNTITFPKNIFDAIISLTDRRRGCYISLGKILRFYENVYLC